jgi:hypothetical protein|tara:strand:- start:811 stop:1479 length:669 start_codon:yes stop_codon:yes gene_type:complete
MGYLDNSTIVVDAVLTKQGRKLLAQGQGLNIQYFTLSDTGIDYTLWNPDHPSGSAFYGEAIENLPNLEALPNSAYFMRNNLISLPRDTKDLPYVKLNGFGLGQTASHTFDENELELDIIMSLAGVDETVGYQVIVPDNSLIQVVGSGWSQSSISGNAQQYLNDQEIASAAVYENSVTVTGGVSTIKIERQSTTTQRTMTLTIISKSTGAYKHFNLTLPRYPV